MRPKGTKYPLEIRRRVAMALLQDGWGVRQVARHVKASPSSGRWRDALLQQGEAGLTAKRYPSSQPKRKAAQGHALLALLSQGARAHAYRHALWALRRIPPSLSGTLG
jgi:transposase